MQSGASRDFAVRPKGRRGVSRDLSSSSRRHGRGLGFEAGPRPAKRPLLPKLPDQPGVQCPVCSTRQVGLGDRPVQAVHPRIGRIPRQFRYHVCVYEKAVHLALPDVNGISRPDFLSPGTSRFAPRGMFSTSHRPMGCLGETFAYHSLAGTTTKGRLVPIC